MPRYIPIAAVLCCFLGNQFSITRAAPPSADRGYELLLNKAYVESAFDQETFDQVWQTWEPSLRDQAAKASPEERRRMAYRRYGLVERPDDPRHRPIQYVVDDRGRWTINCLACHQGTVAGELVPGAANTQFALETLVEDTRAMKIKLGKQLSRLDIGSSFFPLGRTVGTTNAVMFGVALMHYRDQDLNIHSDRLPPRLTHHDHDAPAWWNTSLKERLYCDDFAPQGHRALMQFIASRENGPEKFREWEDDFRHIQAYIQSLEAPKYPQKIDQELAEQGRAVFDKNCSECHGTYHPDRSIAEQYPERIVEWDLVKTDPIRLRSLTPEHRESYGRNWINEYGQAGEVVADPGGYLAPPLAGVWASAPYLHNGSVPTLWDVLNPSERPVTWLRKIRSPTTSSEQDYDFEKVGLSVETILEMPAEGLNSSERRYYFDTRRHGKSAGGHDFPEKLKIRERRAVLEYLKTL
ncbi:c-type cytochrome [Adhaeretor mobilis]|uniref:Cytochrome c domain-containing protein n=1 Tax=Adhaeretor mobilis TaxID=1930276 RepID=A0A517MYC5_9BACT|nr:cytochrome c [Adhaeretor mobilis]QDS99853.1 hypothetical protein HG15A2_31840 [Adhaeretor mobilis]